MEKTETSGHIIWIEDGILRIYVKKTIPSIEAIKENFEAISKLGKKYPVLVDPRDGIALDREQRSYVNKEFEKYATSVAMLNNNVFAPLIFKFVMKLDKPKFPFQLFKSEEKAVAWLKQYETLEV